MPRLLDVLRDFALVLLEVTNAISVQENASAVHRTRSRLPTVMATDRDGKPCATKHPATSLLLKNGDDGHTKPDSPN